LDVAISSERLPFSVVLRGVKEVCRGSALELVYRGGFGIELRGIIKFGGDEGGGQCVCVYESVCLDLNSREGCS